MFSEATCGVQCWMAEQEDCKCACGGANHGILANQDIGSISVDKLPTRNSKILGEIYELQAIGYHSQLKPEKEKVNESRGWWIIRPGRDYTYHHSWNQAKAADHPPAILRYATESQLRGWPELKPFQADPRTIKSVSLLWVKVDMPADNYCEGECEKCFAHRMRFKYKVDIKST